MDLAEIKKTWTEEFEIPDFVVTWLIAEVERLTSERDELKSDIVRYKMHLECAERAAKANGKLAEEAESSLTRSKAEGRREGLEEAAKICEELAHESFNAVYRDAAAAIRQQAQEGKE